MVSATDRRWVKCYKKQICLPSYTSKKKERAKCNANSPSIQYKREAVPRKYKESVKTVWRVLGAEALEFKTKTNETRSLLYSAIHRQHLEKVI